MNDYVKEHHQEDNTYNSSRKSDGRRVDSSGALIASRSDKTVSKVDGGELPTTIHPSSYSNHDLLMSGDNNTHHVRGCCSAGGDVLEHHRQLQDERRM